MEFNLVGREYEKKQLLSRHQSEKSELVAVYGRMRVGKTYLVRGTFNDDFDFQYTGKYEMGRKNQIGEFVRALGRKSGEKYSAPADWFDAFDILRTYLLGLGKEKVTVFLDELPWMDTPKSNFLQAFSSFWNDWPLFGTQLKLFVCGSSTTWMLDKFIGDKGGLYGRTTCSIYLAPFTLRETKDFLNINKNAGLSEKEILDIYMILGGIPYYLDSYDPTLPLSRNVDMLFFRENAVLKNEYEFLFRSLFKESSLYRRVVEIISSKMKGCTREEITSALGKKDGGSLSTVLKNLISCDFIRSYSSMGKKRNESLFQLTDLFCLFYLRFVEGKRGIDENYWKNVPEGVKNAWSGYAFEQVCLHHIREIKNRLSILGVLSNVYSWSSRPFTDKDGSSWEGGQIDLLIDRRDDVINICEMKFSRDEFEITKGYEEHLTKRASLFRKVTGTKKKLVHTFVTLYGVKRNRYSEIVHSEVTMEDLFRQVFY